MTESIKQEIINNIFENGDKLITGPILQTVLIDMIDDVNVKDQAILSKTGSWDEAATQIPNLATKAEVTNLSESIARDLENVDVDLTGYATEQWVQDQGYLKEHQDLSDYATKVYVNEAKSTLESNLNNLSSSVSNDIQNKGEEVKAWVQDQGYLTEHQDLTGYATEQWVESQGYLKEHQDISGLATKTELNDTKDNLQGNITSLSESVARDIANVSVPEGVATEAWVQSQDYASKSYVDNAVSSVDLTGYATETWVQSQGYLKEHQDISGLATKSELTSVSESVQTDITNLSESVANSAVWKKGTGQDSVVQVVTDGTNLPTATGKRAIAIGKNTNASGDYSHAEGTGTNASNNFSHAEGAQTKASGLGSHAEGNQTIASGGASHAEGSSTVASGQSSHAEGLGTTASGSHSHAEGQSTYALGKYSHTEGYSTNASGSYSHAEGYSTNALGWSSHAEGYETIASNQYEHAEGQYNYTSSNQIFSVGAGENVSGTVTKRNAVSILAVPNAETQINTASLFVQNVGGYDGTNPTPGTNDLATVINGLSSGGGSSETLWKKGTGTDSIVQVLTGDNEVNTPSATGAGSIATGLFTKATGDYSHAEGQYANASGSYSHAEGYLTTALGEASHAEGSETMTSGVYSHAEGYNTKALGEASHAEGCYTSASNNYSHAEGNYTKASNTYSHAEGTYAVASGGSSHAEGDHTTASGGSSHAEGNRAVASGSYSHAEGIKTTASGKGSHAEGCLTSATNQYEHAQGICNLTSTNQIFSVGAGEINNPDYPDFMSAKNRRNALSVLAVPNADTKINTASFFVQNVGGYDGTNPTPGTNDLATVLNNTETWTFTLEDGSTVTKNIRIA